ncbi:hypothetical protein K461DRAFT_50880 [Myriangium duriaei CBS 260.36]|uniref:Zn(2)-C6 fungal-type domain-containing protein n=1 Tax=Myriangium duriaei CBS 260.36 TaxID=1168546 RepID=A0A9P4MG71_9PEZI|nr:hypothetical protein K461DRAFT_50880 [Myriangium duriaei CBS 260.36]
MATAEKDICAIRAKKTKVRTGCITCKIRKVKCDEIKPACKRCTDTGRKCDGYLDLEHLKKARQQQLLVRRQHKSPSLVSDPQSDTSFLSKIVSDEDLHWVQYFSQQTAPALSGFADKDFWSCMLPQLSLSDSSIRHALIALGSSHAHFEAEAGTGLGASIVKRDYSLKHYNQAIVSLQRQIGGSSRTTESPLICCLLFICLECLYGNRSLVLEHLRNGLNILDSTRFKVDTPGPVSFLMQKLNHIFSRLDAQSTLFGKPVSPQVLEVAAAPSSMNFSSFIDLTEGQQLLDLLISLSLNFIRSLHDECFAELSGGVSKHALQRKLQEQLLSWRSGLDTLESTSLDLGQFAQSTLSMLRIRHSACFIYLSNCFEPVETSYDNFIPEFTAIVDRSETLVRMSTQPCGIMNAATSTKPLFSLDAWFIPPLFLTAIKCRDPVVRRRAIVLLETNAGREGLWDARLHARVGRRVMDVEERGMLNFGDYRTNTFEDFRHASYEGTTLQDWCGSIPSGMPHESFRIQRADILRTLEEPCRSARVTFFTTRDGALTPLTCWEEDINF